MADKTRRQFLAALPAAAAVFSSHADPRAQARPPIDVRIDGRKLRERIEKLSVYGRPAGGTFADGVSRTAYSDADLAGRLFVMNEIKAAGLEPRIDPAGNIFARRRGGSGPPILFGSHIDSVPNGGVPGRQVGTVGQIEITPNSPNVVPGHARLSIELRDLSSGKLAAIMDDIRARAAQIAASTRTTIEFTQAMAAEAATATADVQSAIERASESLGLNHSRLPSGAGHDAQNMALIGPMGMVFVPSVGGVSHSPKELTRWDDCAHGADVLLRTVLQIDRL